MKVILFLCLCIPAAAQFTPRAEAYGHIGGGWNGDDEGSIGGGIAGGGNIAFRPVPQVGLEVDLTGYRHKRELGFATVEGSGTIFTGNLLYHFTQSRVQPYILAGIGLIRHSLKSGFAPGVRSSDTGGLVNFGAGVKVFVTERVAVRPEWRVAVGAGASGLEAPLYHSRLTLGIGYAW